MQMNLVAATVAPEEVNAMAIATDNILVIHKSAPKERFFILA